MRLWLVSLGLLPILMVGSGPGAIASTPALPPQNGLIAFSTSEGIRLLDARTGKAWTVPGTVDMSSPAWSPDGQLLAVEGWDDDQTSVYTIRPDGSERTLVLEDAYAPSWSPDGEQLVVTRSGRNVSVLATVDADGGDVHQITFDHGGENDGAGEPAWSPDGKWIAFTQGNGAVRLVTPNGEADGVRTVAQEGMNPSLVAGRLEARVRRGRPGQVRAVHRRGRRHDGEALGAAAAGARLGCGLVARRHTAGLHRSEADAEDGARLRRRNAVRPLDDEFRRSQAGAAREERLGPALLGHVPARVEAYDVAASRIRSALIQPALPNCASGDTVAASVQIATRSPRFALASVAAWPVVPRSIVA